MTIILEDNDNIYQKELNKIHIPFEQEIPFLKFSYILQRHKKKYTN